MKILYIPFSLDDAMFDLDAKARKWLKRYQVKDKDAKVFYHGNDNSALQEQVQKALQEGECQIYILSHGINTPKLIVGNQSIPDETYKEMTIDEVAANFESDLLSPKFSKNNVIKLYFCDESGKEHKARKMAVRFREQLSEPYQTIPVKYYTDVSVGVPGSFYAEGLLNTKAAVRTLHMSNDLCHFNLLYVVGNAKSFRHELDAPKDVVHEPQFFKRAAKAIVYPKFAHPLLKQLAEGLVKIVLDDPIFARNADEIIEELLKTLPRDLKSYLVDSLTITNGKLKLEMHINKPRLESYLSKLGVLPVSEPEHSTAVSKKPVQAWVDEEDFMGALVVLGASNLSKPPELTADLDNDEQLGHKFSM
jgi:hypothetical protein